MNDERLDNLIDAHLNGVMADAERLELEDRLLHSAIDRARFWELSEMHVVLHEGAQQKLSDSPPVVPVQPRVKPVTWLTLRPLTAVAAGIVFGMLCTSVVFGLVLRQQASVQTLLMEGFEDAEMIPGRGVPSSVGVWSGDLLPPSEATDEVGPAEGKRMVVLPTVGNKRLGFAYRFVDLTSLPPLEPGQYRQIEVTAQFHGKAPGGRSWLQMRLAVFTEDAVGAREIWKNALVNEMALLHVVKPVKAKSAAWTKVHSTIDVPAEARVLLVSLGAGVPRANPIKTDHYLDEVQVRLITRETPLP